MSGDRGRDAVPRAETAPRPGGSPKDAPRLSGSKDAPRPMLSGHVSPDDLPGVLEFLKLGRKTGLLMIDGARGGGFVALLAGEAVHARAGAFEGQEAFARLLDAASGVFEFHQGERPELPRTLTAPLDSLLMEAAVWRDHHRRDDPRRDLEEPPAPEELEEPPQAGDDDLPTLDLTGPNHPLRAPRAPGGATVLAESASVSPGDFMDEAFTEAVRAHVSALAPACAETVLRAALGAVRAEGERVTKTSAPAFLREVYARLPGEARLTFLRVIPTLTGKYVAHKPS